MNGATAKMALREKRALHSHAVEAYIEEAEHQDGLGYWSKFQGWTEVVSDFDLYVAEYEKEIPDSLDAEDLQFLGMAAFQYYAAGDFKALFEYEDWVTQDQKNREANLLEKYGRQIEAMSNNLQTWRVVGHIIATQ